MSPRVEGNIRIQFSRSRERAWSRDSCRDCGMEVGKRHMVIFATAGLVLAAAACGSEDGPEPSSQKAADTVARDRGAPPGTTAAAPSATQAAADTSGLTQRTGIPFEPVRSTRDTLPLLLIMRNLEQNMAAVQAGIWRGDYDVIREAARNMADHAKIPPRAIERIRTALGEEGLKGFVAADQYWHKKATELAKVADERDMERIVDLTTELLQRCSSCHTDYRQPLRQSPEW